jgi:hypothetical protein
VGHAFNFGCVRLCSSFGRVNLLSSSIFLIDVFRFTAALKRPKLNQDRVNRVLRALYHKDHHYTNFVQPEVLALYSFGSEPNETVLSLLETNQRSNCPL